MSIAPVLAETPSTRNRTPKSKAEKPIAAAKVLQTIEQHVLLDGFKIVMDLDKSRGSYLYNAVDDRRLIDFYGFFGSMPVGYQPSALRRTASATRSFTRSESEDCQLGYLFGWLR